MGLFSDVPPPLSGLLGARTPIVQKATAGVYNNPSIPTRAMPLMERLKLGLGNLATGEDDPNLSAEQNARARRDALLQAGLATIMANSSGQATGLGAIAAGLMHGREAGGQARDLAYKSTQEERLRQALEDPAILAKLTPEQQQMIRLLPPMEAAKVLQQIAFAPPPAPTVLADGSELVDASGRVIASNAKDPDAPSWSGEQRAIATALGIDLNAMTAEQGKAFVAELERLKRASATTVNVNSERRAEFGDTNTLAGQYRTDIGEAQEVASAYARVLTSAQDPSAAGDMALIFSYMKMLDPGSAVREGEYATAQNAASVPERIRAQYNRVVRGERFAPAVRSDFVDRAKRLAEQKQKQIAPVMGRYRARAAAGGVDPSLVVFDPFTELGAVPVEPRGKDRLR